MMTEDMIFLVEESDEGGYEARALGYAIFTVGDTMEELREMIKDAVRCHFDEGEMPRIVRLHMVKDEVMAL